jgi:RNA polymerase sigma-70 factor (ECF subfamily)
LFESSEYRQTIRHVLDQFPQSLQQAVNLVYYQGLKYHEAAEVLGIPVGTVKSRLHTAIHKLNELLPTPV